MSKRGVLCCWLLVLVTIGYDCRGRAGDVAPSPPVSREADVTAHDVVWLQPSKQLPVLRLILK